jgi:hypothetical protein
MSDVTLDSINTKHRYYLGIHGGPTTDDGWELPRQGVMFDEPEQLGPNHYRFKSNISQEFGYLKTNQTFTHASLWTQPFGGVPVIVFRLSEPIKGEKGGAVMMRSGGLSVQIRPKVR